MISYDTNVLIYALESDNSFSQDARRIIIEGEAEGAVLSIIVKHELYTGRVLMGEDTSEVQAALESLMGAKWLTVDEKIVTQAANLTKKYGTKLRGNDALVVATAIVGGAATLYTNDFKLVALNITEIAILPVKKQS